MMMMMMDDDDDDDDVASVRCAENHNNLKQSGTTHKLPVTAATS